ncbi:MAG TPA: autotransporter outer membrane beta-barrel domain-containing protein [Xanthobacteraceae bacterium]|nr:autotransporter outer membrane beta-barrel domain-containing protein [Xanthobacteraceae bacterium]
MRQRLGRAVRIAAIAALFGVVTLITTTSASLAQCARACPPPPPPPQVDVTSPAIGASADYALFGLGSRYLQILSNMGGPSAYRSLFGTGANPGGGGAPASTDDPRYRAWTELYGVAAQTGPQNTFPGDRRRTYGGTAGIALNVTPDAMLGLSVDHSRTGIDIVGFPQHANLDLTQAGVNGSYQWGSWSFSGAGVVGTAGIDSSRDTPFGPATASYRASLWGVVGEADYLIALGSARVVPKFGADWTHTRADAYSEMGGGIDAVSVPAAEADRGRIFAGLEVGNTWVTNSTVVDLSAYAKGMDILVQHVPALTVSAVSGPATPVTVFGVSESKYGVDAGATASVRLSPLARLYVTYDGKFRDGFTSNGGTVGLEFRW